MSIAGVPSDFSVNKVVVLNQSAGTACSLAQFVTFSYKDGTIPNGSYRIEWFNSEWTSGYLEEIYEGIKVE